jgi:hypothetical protein
LLASIILTGVAIVLAKRADARWVTVSVAIGAAAGEIAFVLLDRKLRSWVKYLTIDQWRAAEMVPRAKRSTARGAGWRPTRGRLPGRVQALPTRTITLGRSSAQPPADAPPRLGLVAGLRTRWIRHRFIPPSLCKTPAATAADLGVPLVTGSL